VQALGALLEQLDDWRIEADRDRSRNLEHEPRTGRRPAPAFARTVAMPRPVHSQVGAQLEIAVEPDQQVLADRLHGLDLVPDDPLDLRHRAWTGGTRRAHRSADEVRA
jgi:hypothetical protein